MVCIAFSETETEAETTPISETEKEENRCRKKNLAEPLEQVSLSFESSDQYDELNSVNCENKVSGKAEWLSPTKKFYLLQRKLVGFIQLVIAADRA